MKFVALLLALGCAGYTGPVPMVPRPDTRHIGAVHLDSTVVRQTLDILFAAIPSEAAWCYDGAIADTVLDHKPTRIIRLTRVTQAIADSANPFRVWVVREPRTGCVAPIATGHSHLYMGGGYCTHSNDDANVVFHDPRILVSLVWCLDGRLQIAYQGGRRTDARWREAH